MDQDQTRPIRPIITGKTKSPTGLYTIDVWVGDKVYSFDIASAYVVERAEQLCRRNSPWKAFNLLKERNVRRKEEE